MGFRDKKWTEPQTPLEWVKQGFERIGAEVECAVDHLTVVSEAEDDDEELIDHSWVDVLNHMTSISYGLSAMIATISEHQLASDHAVMEVIRQIMEKKFGIPLAPEIQSWQGEKGTMYAFKIDSEQVPDNVDDIVNGRGGNGDE